MKSYKRIFIFVLLVLLLTALLSPWVVALWSGIIEANPGWEEYRYPFSRIFNRLFMILGIGLFFLFRLLLKIDSMSQLGLQPLQQGYRDILNGFLLALASVIALVVAMSLSQVFTPFFRLPLSTALERSLSALMAALTVGLLEGIFFRGMIFKGLMEDWKPVSAFVAANLFFSAIHFVKPGEDLSLSSVGPWSGLVYLGQSFQPFLNPAILLPGLLGLFLIGLVLSYAFLRTGSLYLSIGLHAGWIFGLKTMRVYGDFRRDDLGWIFGASDPKIVSGVATWIGIVVVGILVHCATRKRHNRNLE